MKRNRNADGTYAKEDYSEEIGKKYGKLTVTEIYTTNRGEKKCKCKCDCGNEADVFLWALKKESTKSCGCIIKNEFYEKLIGKRFGKLVVIEELSKSRFGQTKYKCHCDCGNDIEVYGSNLLYDQTKSCGCVHKVSWYNDTIPSNNTSGIKGVYYNKRNNKWVAKLTFRRKVYRKEFDTVEDAIKYRKYLEEKYHRPLKDEYNEFKKSIQIEK